MLCCGLSYSAAWSLGVARAQVAQGVQTDRQAGRQVIRQADRQTETDRQTGRLAGRQVIRQAGRQAETDRDRHLRNSDESLVHMERM